VILTLQSARALRVLLDGPAYGLQLMKAMTVPTGTLYPLMARLEREGLVSSELEQIDEHAEGRRARRWYRLTGTGEQYARLVLAELAESLRPPGIQ